MDEVEITERMLGYARRRAARVASCPNRELHQFGSEADRILVGYVGEVAVMKALDIRRAEDGFDFDLLYRERKLEIKTVSCKAPPPPHYLCTVNSVNPEGVHKQAADLYVFVRVRYDLALAWILGFIPCPEFFTRGRFVKKGETVAGVVFAKANATVLPISNLMPIKHLDWVLDCATH